MGLVFLNIILCLSIVLMLWIRKRRKRFSIFKDHGIPGPEPNFWYGNLKDFTQKRDRCILEYCEKYGKIFGCFLGAKPMLVITDQYLIKTIQVKEFKSFSNRDIIVPNFGVPHPDALHALSLIKDEEWRRVRTITSSSFSTGKLRKIVPIINHAISIFLENISEKSKRGKDFDISAVYRNLTMDISTKSELGIDTGIQRGENCTFLESAALLLTSDSKDILIGISMCFPELEPIPTKIKLIIERWKYFLGLPSANNVFSTMQDIISQRRNCKEKIQDILQSLIDAKVDAAKLSSIQEIDLIASHDYQQKEENQDGNYSEKRNYVSLSDKSIVSNAIMFLVAGIETTSATLAFATYYLAKYQDIQEKVRKEINNNLQEGENIQYENIFNLHYLDQVISETLRLHSLSILVNSRVAKQTYRYKEFIIPKGMAITCPSSVLHKHPDHWPEPENFNPDRFSPENKAKIDPIMYQPFGNGPRNCIGMRLAQIVMKFTLVRLLKSYRLELERELEVVFSLIISHPKEVRIKATPI